MKKYFFGDFLLAKTLIVNKIAKIKFLKNLLFEVNFIKYTIYKTNTHKN